jgi:hypothetical protein
MGPLDHVHLRSFTMGGRAGLGEGIPKGMRLEDWQFLTDLRPRWLSQLSRPAETRVCVGWRALERNPDGVIAAGRWE